MQFAICNETFQEKGEQWPIDRVFSYCAEVGYDGIEIAPFTLAESAYDVAPKRRKEIRAAAEKAGLQIIGLHWLLASPSGLYVNHPDDAIREKTEAYLKELCAMAADFGAEVLVFGSPKQRSILDGWSSRKTWKRTIEVFKRVADAAAEKGVYFLIEPLPTKETNFIMSLADGLDVIREVDHDHFRLHLDVKAMAADLARRVPNTLRAEGNKYLYHLHANDPNLRGPGFGEQDFVPIFTALDEIGYDRWISVEVFDYSPDPETIATKSLEYLKMCQTEAAKKKKKTKKK
jgi:sugar phosphate isomerase/epimerase